MQNTKGAEDLLSTLGDFTSKENWDKFFSIRGSDDSFEWYAEWPDLKNPLFSQLSNSDETLGNSQEQPEAIASLQILVPGCGSSRLSEHLYDAGYRCITNIDFSKVVISDMLRRNIRSRPDMRWRVMDMTHMQFSDETFNAVLDKGGLDALMEPELGPKLGSRYLSEVKRVLKSRGKFICLTLAESHVLGLLFSKFRFGWKINLHVIPHKPSNNPSFRTFMVVVEKGDSTTLHQIATSFDHSSLDISENQCRGVLQALEMENNSRSQCSSGADILYKLEDLQLGAKGDLNEIVPGRRFQLTLGEDGESRFSYKAVLLDAHQQSDPFSYHCGVFLVPKSRAHEWLFSSEEGQWAVVKSSKAARLIMVLLDASQAHATMTDIQEDLSPLVKTLAPGKQETGARIPYMIADDGVRQRYIVQQVTSSVTGPMTVEDVIYEHVNADFSGLIPSKDSMFRRLTFEKSQGLVQSEALVREAPSQEVVGKTDKNKPSSLSKSKKKRSQRRNDSNVSVTDGSRNNLKVDHNYLASFYHIGMVSGFTLIASKLERVASSGGMVKTVIVGLGAGLLPMFLRGCFSFLDIEVVELDPVIANVARDYFGFIDDKQLKVHIADGIQFVRDVSNITASSKSIAKDENCASLSKENVLFSNGSSPNFLAEGEENGKIDILVIDADSDDPSSGMTCPPADFVEESFLLVVKKSISKGGLFVMNLASRSPVIRETVISRIKSVFSQVFSLKLEADVNEVIFALPTENISIKEDHFPEASLQLQNLLKSMHPKTYEGLINSMKKLERLK